MQTFSLALSLEGQLLLYHTSLTKLLEIGIPRGKQMHATYGSEFIAANTATEQIVNLRHTLRYLGVPIKSKA